MASTRWCGPVSPSRRASSLSTTSPTPSQLADHLRRGAFRWSGKGGPERQPHVGLEVEVIPVDADTAAPVPPWSSDGPSTVRVLDAVADRHGWTRTTNAAGAPAYGMLSGGVLSFEPGGQIEYSAPPLESVSRLLRDIDKALLAVEQEASRGGIRLVARGVDPFNPPESATLRLGGERYTRMAEHFARLGPAGHIMMCQTAALHVNVDPVGPPDLAWRVANAMAPVLLATFANSRVHAGSPTGARSWRAEQWRRLDDRRTGVFAFSSDPVEDYLAFALEAPAFLLGPPHEEARPFREWLVEGASVQDFDRHLSTLFPEVRPRGYLELRSFDALPLRLIPAAVVVTVGVLQDPASLESALALLPSPTDEALARAGRVGLGDLHAASLARSLFQLGLEGARRLGETVVSGHDIERATGFMEELTARSRDPGSLPGDTLF
jgi:glutamate--cysteine ligase